MTRRKWVGIALPIALLLAAAALAQEPPDAGLEFAKGLAALSRGDLAEASKRFETVVQLDPKSFEAHNNLAVIYTEQGNYDAALAEMNRVLELQPDYYRGRKNLAELYARLARQSFLQAAAVAPPDEKDALEARARLMDSPAGSAAPGARGAPLEAAAKPASTSEPVAAAKVDAPAPAAAKPAAPAGPAAAAPPPSPPPQESTPASLVALANGVPAIVLTSSGMRLFRHLGGEIRPAERVPLKNTPTLPAAPALYVAVPLQGKVDLVPLGRGGKVISISDAPGRGDLVIDTAALGVMRDMVQPYLTPAVLAAAPKPIVPEIADAKKGAMLAAFAAWEKAWDGEDLQGYLDSYATDYNPPGGPGHDKWREQRERVFERSGDITVKLSEPVILEDGESLITLTQQDYGSKLQSSSGIKMLTWIPEPKGWKITREEMLSEKKG